MSGIHEIRISRQRYVRIQSANRLIGIANECVEKRGPFEKRDTIMLLHIFNQERIRLFARKYFRIEESVLNMADVNKPSIEVTGHRSELYREITPDAFWGYIRPGHLESVFITSQINVIEERLSNGNIKKVEHIAEINIKFTPQLAKQFALWLLERLILYENAYGKIVLKDDFSGMNINMNELKTKIDELLEKIKVDYHI